MEKVTPEIEFIMILPEQLKLHRCADFYQVVDKFDFSLY